MRKRIILTFSVLVLALMLSACYPESDKEYVKPKHVSENNTNVSEVNKETNEASTEVDVAEVEVEKEDPTKEKESKKEESEKEKDSKKTKKNKKVKKDKKESTIKETKKVANDKKQSIEAEKPKKKATEQKTTKKDNDDGWISDHDQRDEDSTEVTDKDGKPIDKSPVNHIDGLDEALNAEMLSKISKYHVSLVENGPKNDDFPKSNLQAVEYYEDEYRFGYVVRYGQGKIGLLERYHESTTESMTLFGMPEGSENLKSDTAQAYKDTGKILIENNKVQ